MKLVRRWFCSVESSDPTTWEECVLVHVFVSFVYSASSCGSHWVPAVSWGQRVLGCSQRLGAVPHPSASTAIYVVVPRLEKAPKMGSLDDSMGFYRRHPRANDSPNSQIIASL